MRQTFFITGTDTGVGKTVFTRLFAQFLHQRGFPVAALKPVCSGGREDARALHAALEGALPLDEINPWHFRQPIAPVLAARREGKSVKLAPVLAHLRAWRRRSFITLIEGAGGLLSPLGDDFDSRDLIIGLGAVPVVVALNKLGAVNHVLLTVEALPGKLRDRAVIILVSPHPADSATNSNARLLRSYLLRQKLYILPWLGNEFNPARALRNVRVQQTFAALLKIST